ncbi:hypothetical protein [Nannocystis radixulma]|uniref:Uncharacterized protein n=1 Tax=Nannocystis radixulma TaxID=2995305 RepID=A0ABT5AYC8_9BACT|nr:hypothetical protein [Nannocystis radixulma]MDC0666838.1 hypothetical protein [Nannocystis radixulma]
MHGLTGLLDPATVHEGGWAALQIQREKFFALTASLAGFWPNAACTINLGGGTANTGESTAGTTTTTTTTTGTTTTGTSTTGETATSTGTPTTGAPTSGGTTDAAEDDCCLAHGAPGCADDAVEACVCDEDPFCCGLENGNWDETCVANVNTHGCGTCDAPGTGSTS